MYNSKVIENRNKGLISIIENMLEIIVYVAQIVLAVCAFFITFLLLKKNKHYRGNQFLALSLALVGIYALPLFIYKILNSAVILQYAIRISFIALIFAVYFLYLTIQVLMYSRFVFTMKFVRNLIILGIGIGISLCMVFVDWIVLTGQDITTMDYVDWVFYLFAAYIGIMLVASMINLYFAGIRKSSGISKKKMLWFFFGLVFMVFALITEGLGGVFKGEGLAILFDLFLFSCLSIGAIFMAFSLLLKNPESSSS